MKSSTAILLALATLVPAGVSVGAGVSQGAERNTNCWDEYNMGGTRMYRTVVSADIPLEDCTPGPGCYYGYRVRDGMKDRRYVPHGMHPANACNVIPSGSGSTAITTTTAPPTTTTTTPTAPVSPPTTLAVTTTTTAPTTTAPTTTTPTSTPTLTPLPPGAAFAATFDNNTGLDRFNIGVWHRDPYLVMTTQWQGDHDLNCGAPTTTRTIRRSNPNESFYTCKDHLMTSIGDTSGYSVGWFSPKPTFDKVTRIDFDVNLTDLGTRQWWKVGVVSDRVWNTTNSTCCGSAPGFLHSDVDAADLPTSLDDGDVFMASWSGGLSGGYPGFLKVGNATSNVQANPTPDSKADRHPASLVDNGNGTVTFTVAGNSVTKSGSFPTGPVHVVFTDHNYTPSKQDPASKGSPIGYTWHWDNIIIN